MPSTPSFPRSLVLLTVWCEMASEKGKTFKPWFNFFGHHAPVSVIEPDLSFCTHFATV